MEFPLQSHRYNMEKYAVVAFQMSSFLWLLTFCCGVDYKHLGLIVLYYCFGNGGMFAAGALEVMAGELFRHFTRLQRIGCLCSYIQYICTDQDQWYLTTHVLISLKCVQVGTQGAKRWVDTTCSGDISEGKCSAPQCTGCCRLCFLSCHCWYICRLLSPEVYLVKS